MSQSKADGEPSFESLGIAPEILNQLNKLNFVTPTPIQNKAIPIAIEGNDVVGIAQTGTGKTLAFSIPMIQQLQESGGKGLILTPTRELALQVEESLSKIGRPLGIRTAVLIGGTSINPQISKLRNNPDVIIATPGRLIDHLEQKTTTLDEVDILILDEADRMLDMGFMPQIKKIIARVPSERQTMLFSATMPPKITEIARAYMKRPIRVEVAPAGSASDNVKQELYLVPMQDKTRLLDSLLKEEKGTALVFTRTKYRAKKVTLALRRLGYTAAEIHSNRSLKQRKDALAGFKNGRFRVLVATDIASRGIDVIGIQLVVNYDLPDQNEDYVHRIGRTGRAGRKGLAISFVAPEQKRQVIAIERLIRNRLQLKPLPELPEHKDLQKLERRDFQDSRGRRSSGGRNYGGYSGRHSGGSRSSSSANSRNNSGRRSQGRSSSGAVYGSRTSSEGSSNSRPSIGYGKRKPGGRSSGGRKTTSTGYNSRGTGSSYGKKKSTSRSTSSRCGSVSRETGYTDSFLSTPTKRKSNRSKTRSSSYGKKTASRGRTTSNRPSGQTSRSSSRPSGRRSAR